MPVSNLHLILTLNFKQSFKVVTTVLHWFQTESASHRSVQAHTDTVHFMSSWWCIVFRVRPLSDGSNPWSTSLVKSQKSVPLAALFAEQGELKIHFDALCFNI